MDGKRAVLTIHLYSMQPKLWLVMSFGTMATLLDLDHHADVNKEVKATPHLVVLSLVDSDVGQRLIAGLQS